MPPITAEVGGSAPRAHLGAQAAGPALPPGSRPRPAQSGWRWRRCARTGSDSAGWPCSPPGHQAQGPGRSAGSQPDAGEACTVETLPCRFPRRGRRPQIWNQQERNSCRARGALRVSKKN